MSTPQQPNDSDREPHAGRCVVTPLELVSELSGMVPRAIERGRGQIKLARALGRLVIEHSPIGALPALRPPPVENPVVGGSTRRVPDAPTAPPTAEPAESGETTPASAAAAPAPIVPVDDLALPDYDSLSASQVIPRLRGLDPAELEDLRRYEAAGRSRRTILNKIAQLQSST